MALATSAPFPYYVDLSGHPLDDGYVYFGVANQNPETTPVAVYWDAAATQPAAQPIRTMNGFTVRNGTPAIVYAAADYSLSVRNRMRQLAFYAATSADFGNDFGLQSQITTAVATVYSDFANTANAALGDALVGVKTSRAGSVAGTQHQVNEENYSVFRFMTPVQIADVTANTALVDVTAPLQAAISALPIVYLPLGTYKVSSKLTLGLQTQLIGAHEHATIIKGGHAGVILEYPISAYDCVLQNLSIFGTGCTGVAVAAGGGTLHDYLIRFSVHHVHFGWELAYGINADSIFLDAYKCTFGYDGYGPKLGTMKCIKSFSVGGNFTNINTVRNCLFYNSTFAIGAASAIAVDLSGGDIWEFTACDWEQGGQAMRCADITKLSLTDCWLEALVSVGNIIDSAASVQKTEFRRCNFLNLNVVTGIVQWNSGASPGIVVDNCTFTITGGGFCIYDNTTTSTGLDGAGKVEWTNNVVSGGAVGMTTQTGTYRDGNKAARGFVTYTSTAGAPTLRGSSEPVTFVRNGVGDVTVTLTHAAATSAAALAPTVTVHGDGGIMRVAYAFASSTTAIRVVTQTLAGAAAEETVTLHWGGA